MALTQGDRKSIGPMGAHVALVDETGASFPTTFTDMETIDCRDFEPKFLLLSVDPGGATSIDIRFRNESPFPDDDAVSQYTWANGALTIMELPFVTAGDYAMLIGDRGVIDQQIPLGKASDRLTLVYKATGGTPDGDTKLTCIICGENRQ